MLCKSIPVIISDYYSDALMPASPKPSCVASLGNSRAELSAAQPCSSSSCFGPALDHGLFPHGIVSIQTTYVTGRSLTTPLGDVRVFCLISGTTSLEKLLLSHQQLRRCIRKDRDVNCSSQQLPSPAGSEGIQPPAGRDRCAQHHSTAGEPRGGDTAPR